MAGQGYWALADDLAGAFLKKAQRDDTTATAALETLMDNYVGLTVRQRNRWHTAAQTLGPIRRRAKTKMRSYRMDNQKVSRFEAICNGELRVATMVVEALMYHYLHAEDPLSLR